MATLPKALHTHNTPSPLIFNNLNCLQSMCCHLMGEIFSRLLKLCLEDQGICEGRADTALTQLLLSFSGLAVIWRHALTEEGRGLRHTCCPSRRLGCRRCCQRCCSHHPPLHHLDHSSRKRKGTCHFVGTFLDTSKSKTISRPCLCETNIL